MPDDKIFISEKMFSDLPHSDFDQMSVGDAYDPYWGEDTFIITLDDIEALKNGKVLYTTINSEYAILIKLAKETKT